VAKIADEKTVVEVLQKYGMNLRLTSLAADYVMSQLATASNKDKVPIYQQRDSKENPWGNYLDEIRNQPCYKNMASRTELDRKIMALPEPIFKLLPSQLQIELHRERVNANETHTQYKLDAALLAANRIQDISIPDPDVALWWRLLEDARAQLPPKYLIEIDEAMAGTPASRLAILPKDIREIACRGKVEAKVRATVQKFITP
jgi:hypothetical protein